MSDTTMKTDTKVKGFILAGNHREYCYFLFKNRLKGKEYPKLTMFVQMQNYHEIPLITCVGTYYQHPKFVEIRKRAIESGAEVVDWSSR